MIKFENKLYNVNSYHNFKIVYKGKKKESLGLGIDNSIEYFKYQDQIYMESCGIPKD